MPEMYCPICHKQIPTNGSASPDLLPFCSERCRMVDLGTWFSDGYVIGSSGDDDDTSAE